MPSVRSPGKWESPHSDPRSPAPESQLLTSTPGFFSRASFISWLDQTHCYGEHSFSILCEKNKCAELGPMINRRHQYFTLGP